MMVASKKNIVRNWLERNHRDKFLQFSTERKRKTHCFYECYIDLCKLQNIAPASAVNSHTRKNILDVYGDRLKIDEWAPILEALKLDRNLHFIAFRSRYNSKRGIEEANTVAKARTITKQPVLLSKFILQLLMDSLAQCLAKSTSIICIELDGLPITKDCMNIFCDGIAANVSLQTISFCNSHIGDEGCKQLCLLMRNMPSVLHLDLSNCDLTVESTIAIAETLRYQYLQCFAESWKQSLRYCEPNIESMPGLRRIILNNNTCIGDEGVKKLTDVLKEDFWIRAIDLQNCGISNSGAQSILEILDVNSTLSIVDVRENKYIDDVLLRRIMLKLYYNNANKDAHEYNWIIPRPLMTNTSSLSLRVTKYDAFDKRVPSMELQSPNQRQNIMKLNIQNPTLTNLKRIKQPKCDEMNVGVHAKEYLPEQRERNCFCLMNQEAYDAVIESLGRFHEFLDLIQNKNSIALELSCKGDGDHAVVYCKCKNKPLIINDLDSKDAVPSCIE